MKPVFGIRRRHARCRADVLARVALVPPGSRELVHVNVVPGDNHLLARPLRNDHRRHRVRLCLLHPGVYLHVVGLRADGEGELLGLGQDVGDQPAALVPVDVLEHQADEAVSALIQRTGGDAPDLVLEVDRRRDVLQQSIRLEHVKIAPEVLVPNLRLLSGHHSSSFNLPRPTYLVEVRPRSASPALREHTAQHARAGGLRSTREHYTGASGESRRAAGRGFTRPEAPRFRRFRPARRRRYWRASSRRCSPSPPA